MRLRIWLLLASVALAAGAAGQLVVVNPRIAQSEGGDPMPPGFAHVPGEVIFFSSQVEGYKATSAGKIRLSYKIDALDPKGVKIIEPVAGEIEETLAPQDKDWKPLIHHEIPIPPLAGSGTYKVVVTVTDEIAKTTAGKDVTFDVRGHGVELSDTLVIRNFHFYRGEQDTEPLATPAYRPGDAVWARFDIVGFKYGEGNAIDVSYGVTVTSPTGKVLYSNPEADAERSQSFYPKRYVPGIMSLETKRDTRPGEYGVLITVHDNVGKQAFEARRNFSIQ